MENDFGNSIDSLKTDTRFSIVLVRSDDAFETYVQSFLQPKLELDAGMSTVNF